MKLSLNWLKEFVVIPKNIFPQKLGELLTVHTVEVEGMEKIGNDVIYEIDNKSMTHRPDLWGVYGMAREVAAIIGGKLKKLEAFAIKAKKSKVSISITVENKSDCPRYVALALDNVKIQASPKWLSERLESVGVRSINNIVDATNYIMLEVGQPLHAFDLDKLSGSGENKVNIIVRRAKNNESIVTLDGVKRDLNSNITVIADKENPIALAGVMGGAKAEISEYTTRVVLESANFDAINIRKAENILGLRTEASSRFEKSLDPQLPFTAMQRLAAMIQKLIPGVEIASAIADKNNISLKDRARKTVFLNLEEVNRKIGVEIKKTEVKKILTKLGFEVKGDMILKVTIPFWRATRDITEPHDLVEEIARIYGYQNIPLVLPKVSSEPPMQNKERQMERQVKNILINGLGFSEVYNYSFVNEDQLSKMGLSDNNFIRLKNPISKNATLMRQSLMPNILENVKDNLRYFDSFRLFEMGSVYKNIAGEEKIRPDQNAMLPKQDKMLVGVYVDKANNAPFYAAKQSVESLLKKLNIVYNYTREFDEKMPYLHSARYIKIVSKNKELGYIAELNPTMASNLDIGARVGLFEINFSDLAEINPDTKVYKALPKYPFVKLDVSILVDKKFLWKDIETTVKSIQPDLIKSVDIFDLYEGKGLPANKKSLAFRIEYRSDEKTLTDGEVNRAHGIVMEKLRSMGGEARK